MSDATQDQQAIVPIRRSARKPSVRRLSNPIEGEFHRRDDVDELKRQALTLVDYRLRWVASEMHSRMAPLVREGANPDRVSEQLRQVAEKHGAMLERQLEALLEKLPSIRLEPRPDRSLLAFPSSGGPRPIAQMRVMPKLSSNNMEGPRDK